MIIQIMTLFSIILFYSIYFGKMRIQKKQGIVTNQMTKGNKDKKLQFQENVMRLLTIFIIPIELLSIFLQWSMLPEIIRYTGIVMGYSGVLIFFLSIYTMKDSWRAGITDEKTELITSGVYKISRNPAFIGFYLLYLGILLAYFNFFLLVISIMAIVSLHLQILHEEKSLIETFEAKYIEYMRNVRRYVGRRR